MIPVLAEAVKNTNSAVAGKVPVKSYNFPKMYGSYNIFTA